uniref:Uncharacterized protein n=1 Tax=Serinus canaria TaxID=9135 RepID=A0A8C9NU17_SERCA
SHLPLPDTYEMTALVLPPPALFPKQTSGQCSSCPSDRERQDRDRSGKGSHWGSHFAQEMGKAQELEEEDMVGCWLSQTSGGNAQAPDSVQG